MIVRERRAACATAACAIAACALAACVTPPSQRPSEVTVPPAMSSPAIKAQLAAEQRRLADLFQGTPVIFVNEADGSLRVEIPLRYAFDTGRSAVKPPLGAVLDRIARSQKDEPTRIFVAAPSDPGDKSLQLATARATSVRSYLAERGIAEARCPVSGLSMSDRVRLIVADPALRAAPRSP